jgi:PAS domain S-box-containing protein
MMFFYSLPLAAVSVLAVTASALITYRHRERRVIAGAILVLGSSLWLMMQALELTSASLLLKLLFYSLRYVGVVTVPAAWLVLAMLISGYERQVNKRNILALTAVPILTLLLIFTNESHNLMFSNVSLNLKDPGLPLVVTFGPAYWVLAVLYSYALMVAGFVLIARRIIATRRSWRVLGVQILLVSMVPWILNLLYVLDPNLFMNFEPSSLVISVAGAVLLWRIVKLPILGVLPVAHETLVDSMSDAIFVLDERNHIVDANPKAQDLLGSTLSQTLAASIEKTWPEWPTIKRALDSGAKTGRPVTLGEGSDRRVYELRDSTIEGLVSNASYQLITLRDVTERKRVENALQESERRLRLITDHMLDMIIQCDLQGIFEYVSPSHRMLGYEPKDLLGRSVFELIHPEDVESSVNAFQKGVQTRSPQRAELRFKHADGHYVWIESVGNPIFDEKNEVSGAIIGSRDITERMQAEEALRESEDRLRRITDSMLDVMVETDLQGICKYASPSCKRIMGYDPKDLVGKSLFDFVHPEDLAAVTATIQRAVSTGRLWTGGRFECRYRHADGHYVWLENLANIVRDHKGQMRGSVIGARDITERKIMEEKLKHYSNHLEQLVEERTMELATSERKYRLLVDNMADVVFTIDLEGNYTFCTPQAEKMTGYTTQQLLSMNMRELIAPEDLPRVLKSLEARARSSKELPPIRFDIVEANGARLPIEVKTSRQLDGNKLVGVHGVARDISERKRMEEQLLQSERLASIGGAAAMVGHDLRNPLQSTANTLYLARKLLSTRKAKDKMEAVELLEKLDDQIYYMDKIVSDLQDYARPVRAELIETNLGDLIREAISAARIPGSVQCSVMIKEDLSNTVTNPTLLKRVLTNLIVNAVQAMPTGGNLTITAGKIQDSTVLTVQDTGTGIPAENLEKIFNPFFTTKAQGQGLGLAVCKRLVEAQGGTITVKSKVGEGSSFKITIPNKIMGAA